MYGVMNLEAVFSATIAASAPQNLRIKQQYVRVS